MNFHGDSACPKDYDIPVSQVSHTLEVLVPSGSIPPNDAALVTLMMRLHEARALFDLERYEFEPVDGQHRHRLTSMSGQTWRNRLTFTSPTDEDPIVTFRTADTWTRAQRELAEILRSLAAALRAAYGVTTIRSIWTVIV